MSAEDIIGLMSIILCQIMEHLRPKTVNPLAIFVLSILLILCHPNISQKFYHEIGEDLLSTEHKIRTDKCCFGRKLCQIMGQIWPKTGNPLDFFVCLYFINIMSYIVVMDHRTFKIKNIQNSN